MSGPRAHLTRRTIMLVRSTSAPYGGANGIVDGTPLTLACDNFGVLYTQPAPVGPSKPSNVPVPASQFATATPAVATVASASVAASGINPFHNVASTLSWSWGDTAAVAGFIVLVLRDGASGVGPILWSKTLGPFPAGTMIAGDITFSDNGAPFGSTATAMTLEFLAAPSATGRQSVSLTARAGN
jgi:hypothetical protein